MTAVLLMMVVAGTVCGDLLKAYAMRQQGPPSSLNGRALQRFAKNAAKNGWFVLCLGAYAMSLLAFMAMLSYQDVSFVVPATALTYAVETLLAAWILREKVDGRRWLGAAFVVAGVWLVA